METSDDPITIALVAGAGISAFGAVQQGKAAEAQAKSEQAILEYNARLKEREAKAERDRAIKEAQRFEKQGEAFRGKQKVSIAKGGVLSTEGSPLALIDETIEGLEEDKRSIISEGFLRESFRLSEAEGLRFQGRSALARGKNIKTGSQIGAAGTLLTGLGGAAKTRNELKPPTSKG